MRVTLYGWRLSPFVEKVIRGVQCKGLTWELKVPKNPAHMRKWNPQTGKMPAADLAGERLFDSTFILRRLDELMPNPPLISDDPTTAARQRQIEDWADESLYWYVMAFRWSRSNGHASADRILDAISAPALLRPLISRIMRRTVRRQVAAQGTGRIPEALLPREFGERLDDLVRILGDRAFFFSDHLSVADLAVFGQLVFAAGDVSPEANAAVHSRPKLVEYMRRVEQATSSRSGPHV